MFAIYGHGGHLGHVTLTIYINFRSPFPRSLHKNLALIAQAVSEKKKFENVNGRTTDGRTPDPWVSYKLAGESSAQVS